MHICRYLSTLDTNKSVIALILYFKNQNCLNFASKLCDQEFEHVRCISMDKINGLKSVSNLALCIKYSTLTPHLCAGPQRVQ